MGFRSSRLKAGLRVADVMAKLGVSDAAVYYWETGQYNPRLPMLQKLAELYGCTLEELLAPDSVSADVSDKTDMGVN